MAIKLLDNAIQVGNFTISEASDGINFTGVLRSSYVGNGFQGSVSGYSSGGSGGSNVIDKFPFAVDTNATDVGDLTGAIREGSSSSSATHGYTAGGIILPSPPINTIQKFPFAVDTNASDVGDLLTARRTISGGQSSSINGYCSGGGQTPGVDLINTIEKFPFSTNSNATDVGDLTAIKQITAGQSSSTHGYASGGATGPVSLNSIDKFPFATDTNATDAGDLTQDRVRLVGNSSTISGYSDGGVGPAPASTTFNTIDKFPFATDTNATDVGDLTAVKYNGSGQSSTSFGYHSGGAPPTLNVIEKFPFAVDSNSSDVGDLTQGRYDNMGHQD